MLKQLILENFRQHEALTIDFENGLVVIRGRNEAGKTTVQEAIAYVLFGTKALRQAFAEYPTWGKPESALKVTLTFELGGVTYTVWRKKSGAELTGPGVLVTGQDEVRKYIETLIGTDAKTAAYMMFASQNALRGALTEGAKAVELISELADFDLIDRVVALVQAKLPTGSTKAVEERLKTLAEQARSAAVPELDVSALEAEQLQVNIELGKKHESMQGIDRAAKEIDTVKARQQIGDASTAQMRVEGLTAQLASARTAAAAEVPVPQATQTDIDGWRAAMEAAKAGVAARAAWAAVQALQLPEVTWEGDRRSFDAELRSLSDQISANTLRRNEAYLERAEAIAQQVREKTCGLCGKDLTDVPEVVRRNADLSAKVGEVSLLMAQLDESSAALKADLQSLQELSTQAQTYETTLHRHSAYLDILDTRVPADFRWRGEPPAEIRNPPDYAGLIRAAETALQVFGRAQGAKDAAVALVKRLEAEHAAAVATHTAAAALVDGAKERLKQADMHAARVSELSAEISQLQYRASWLEQEISHRKDIHAQLVKSHAQLQAQVSQAAEELQGMNRNNALLAKLRQARPQIADKLWSIVLSSVSNYFSQVRGVQSCVSREAAEFRIDGKPVDSFSGSTIDSLGLALRKALTKTFLPNMSMMMLDEPAHGMDDEREANMLGALVASGFEQVVLITHSPQSDAFANQVVQL